MWNTLIVNPLVQTLVFLHGVVGSYGVAIILLTVIAKAITMPLTWKQLQASQVMQELQPQLQALQKQYGEDKEKLAAEQMRLYQEVGANPLMGCLPMLIQMPLWFGLYRALQAMAQTGMLHEGFLWLPSLAQPTGLGWLWPPAHWQWPDTAVYLVLPILTVVSQVVAQRMTTSPASDDDPQQAAMSQVMLVMPLMFGFFAVQVPSGLALYWATSNGLSIVQQYFVTGRDRVQPSEAKARSSQGEGEGKRSKTRRRQWSPSTAREETESTA